MVHIMVQWIIMVSGLLVVAAVDIKVVLDNEYGGSGGCGMLVILTFINLNHFLVEFLLIQDLNIWRCAYYRWWRRHLVINGGS